METELRPQNKIQHGGIRHVEFVSGSYFKLSQAISNIWLSLDSSLPCKDQILYFNPQLICRNITRFKMAAIRHVNFIETWFMNYDLCATFGCSSSITIPNLVQKV